MSLEYDQYIREHRDNVKKGLEWMRDNISSVIDGIVMEDALANSERHDESKYSKDEYDAYDAYFYGGNRSYKVLQDFNVAWLKHIHKNPHHWQYWVLINDDPEEGSKALDMPLADIYEMIADWWTFSWRNGNLMEIFGWYADHREHMMLSLKTRITVETILQAMGEALTKQMILERPGQIFEEFHLEHSGTKGMKWGVRNYQNLDGTWTELGKERRREESLKRKAAENIKQAKVANLSKWGTDSKHNALYITGISGSGKSTTAEALAGPKDSLIRLDAYTEKDMEDEGIVYTSRSMQKDDGFTAYLKENFPDWKRIGYATEDGSDGTLIRNSAEYRRYTNKLLESIEDYAAQCYDNNKRVIVEGMQIADDNFEDSSFFDGKPVVILQADLLQAANRAFERDGKQTITPGTERTDDILDYFNWSGTNQRKQDRLATALDATNNSEEIDSFITKLEEN